MAEVEVYSDAAEIELLLNGVSQGRARVSEEFRADLRVPYAPGTLTAVAYDAAGAKTGESSLVSAAGALSLRVEPEGKAAAGQPLYVNIDLVGENGVVERNIDKTLTLRVEGAELLGFGSANPRTEERFETGIYTTYYGRSQAVLLPSSREIRLTVTGPGLDLCEKKITVSDCAI